MFEELIEANDANKCWKIIIKARDGSKLQILALIKYLGYCEVVLQVANIFRNFPMVRDKALEKLSLFAIDFKSCFKVYGEVSNIPELKDFILGLALKLAETLNDHKKLRRYLEDGSEKAYLCDQEIARLSRIPNPELVYSQ